MKSRKHAITNLSVLKGHKKQVFSFIFLVIMPPEECKELEPQNSPNEDGSFTKEVFQEAFGELYTEHVKITVKNGNSDIRSAFLCQDTPSVSTFKKTYFGASKSHRPFDVQANYLQSPFQKIK